MMLAAKVKVAARVAEVTAAARVVTMAAMTAASRVVARVATVMALQRFPIPR